MGAKGEIKIPNKPLGMTFSKVDLVIVTLQIWRDI